MHFPYPCSPNPLHLLSSFRSIYVSLRRCRSSSSPHQDDRPYSEPVMLLTGFADQPTAFANSPDSSKSATNSTPPTAATAKTAHTSCPARRGSVPACRHPVANSIPPIALCCCPRRPATGPCIVS